MRGALGFSVLRFSLFFRSVFRFWWSLRFADFSFFSIWFSVFVKNTSGFSVLVPDEGERQTCYKLGCVLSHQSKVLVPKARHNGVSS